jgi:hypothetical protein
VPIRDDVVTEGALSGSAFAGYFIVEASGFDHAVWIARMTPVADGWVEVRPPLTA